MFRKCFAAPLFAMLVLAALLVTSSLASSIQTVKDPVGDAHGAGPDIIRATARTVGTRQVIVFTTRRAFKTRNAPTLNIVHSPADYSVGGRSVNGAFSGTGAGTAPRARITRPSSTQIRYSFHPGDLQLTKSYRWFGASRAGSHDRIPDKGSITTKIATPAPSASGVRIVPVSFAVVNANTSMVPCSVDGAKYTIKGSLVLPAGVTPSSATLYVHGLGFGAYFWHFTAIPGYDYASAEAQKGHASVLIDRLGYGSSSIPPGAQSCVGGQASVIHQVIQALRKGTYEASGESPSSFKRIGLAGHSAGGQLVQIEAYSFRDIDALAVMDWADQSYSPMSLTAFGEATLQCVPGGVSHGAGQPAGYGSYGQTAQEYDGLMFHDADPQVVTAANAVRSLDPCGDFESILTGVAVDATMISSINVPVAYVWGDQDANYIVGTPWWQLQEALYLASPKVTDVTLVNTGHAVTLERSAPALISAMNSWLSANGL